MATVFVTQYALTAGIEEIETEIKENYHGDKYIVYAPSVCFYLGKECFLTRQEAVNKAENMRKKKIASLQKQIRKLENIKFE